MSLPAGYVKIDYIEAAGAQYIKTGFTPNQNTRVVAEFSGAPRTKEQHLFGSRTSTSSSDRFMFIAAGGSANCYRTDFYNNNANIAQTYNFSDKFIVDKNKNKTYLNGELVATNTSGTFTKKYGIWLLGSNTAGTASPSKSGTRLHSCQIYDNDVIVRDYVPCKDNTEVIGLYDLINNVFYKNGGSGSFIAGPISRPNPPTDLTYIFERRLIRLNWKPSSTENVSGYMVTYSKDGNIVMTRNTTELFDEYQVSIGEWIISVKSIQDELYSDEITVSFSIRSIENPKELQGSIADNGIASITWTPSTDNKVKGYSIYMLSPQRVLVGYAPYGKPEFKFAFSNESLTEKLIEMSSYLENAFLYQLEKRTQYVFSVVSYNDETENTPEDGPKINMYYDTHPIFDSMSLKPNPAFTKETLLISAGITEQIESVITTS